MTGSCTGDLSISEWYAGIEQGIRILNAIAPHQQDLLQTDQGAARPICASHHGGASHLTKTVVRLKGGWRGIAC